MTSRGNEERRWLYLQRGVGLFLLAVALVKLSVWQPFLQSLVAIDGDHRAPTAWLLVFGEFSLGTAFLFDLARDRAGVILLVYVGLLAGGRIALPLAPTCRCLGPELPSGAAWAVLLLLAGIALAMLANRSTRLALRGACVGLLCAVAVASVAKGIEVSPHWRVTGIIGRAPGEYVVRLEPPGACTATRVRSSCECLAISLTGDNGLVVSVRERIPHEVVPYLTVSYECSDGRAGVAEAIVRLE